MSSFTLMTPHVHIHLHRPWWFLRTYQLQDRHVIRPRVVVEAIMQIILYLYICPYVCTASVFSFLLSKEVQYQQPVHKGTTQPRLKARLTDLGLGFCLIGRNSIYFCIHFSCLVHSLYKISLAGMLLLYDYYLAFSRAATITLQYSRVIKYDKAWRNVWRGR